MKKLIPILFLLSFHVSVFAQEESESDTTDFEYYDDYLYDSTIVLDTMTWVEGDSSSYNYNYASVSPGATEASQMYLKENLTRKKINKSTWEDIVGDTDYTESKRKEKKAEEKEEKKLPFSAPAAINPAIMKAISYAVIVALFAFILYYVLMNTKFTRKVKKLKVTDGNTVVDDIDEFDSDELLKNALASNDLRLAIRAHYLMLLRKLNEVGLIKWKKDKTNRDYLSELYGRNDCFNDVQKLTLAYELVWYGERSVSQESFQRLAVDFESVSKTVAPKQPVG